MNACIKPRLHSTTPSLLTQTCRSNVEWLPVLSSRSSQSFTHVLSLFLATLLAHGAMEISLIDVLIRRVVHCIVDDTVYQLLMWRCCVEGSSKRYRESNRLLVVTDGPRLFEGPAALSDGE